MQIIVLVILLLALVHQTEAINRCNSEKRYKCGHDSNGSPLKGTQPWWTQTCEEYECCCPSTEGWPYEMKSNQHQLNVCDHVPSNDKFIPSGTSVGCWACGEGDSCFNIADSKVGDEACVGIRACYGSYANTIWNNACVGREVCDLSHDNTIGEASCKGYQSCHQSYGNTIGKFSCIGDANQALSGYACYKSHDMTIGEASCVNAQACQNSHDMTIDENSCRAGDSCTQSFSMTVGKYSCNNSYACQKTKETTIGHYSCNGESSTNNKGSCSGQLVPTDDRVNNKYNTIRDYSCNEDQACYLNNYVTIGSQSCNSKISCRKINPKTDAGVEPDESDRVTIGDNSCNYDNYAGNAINNDSIGVCEGCASGSIVPPFVCNGSDGIMDDLSPVLPLENDNYKCNYCLSITQQTSVSVTLTGATEGNMCNAAAAQIKGTVKDAIEGHVTFRNHYEGTTKGCKSKDKVKENLFDKTCTITQSFVTKVRGLNKDEEPMRDAVEKVLEGLSLGIGTIRVTNGNCKEKKRKGGKSSKRGKGQKTAKAGSK